MNTHPLPWLKQIQEEMTLTAQKIPLWGAPPPFPWEEFSKELQTSLSIQDFSLQPQKSGFFSPEEFLLSFGKNPIIKTFELAPLAGNAYFIIASESLEKITTLSLASGESSKGFSDPQFQLGFFEYLLLSATHSFSKLAPYPDLHVQWLETKPLPSHSCFYCDLSLLVHGETFAARLLFSPSFHEAFVAHFGRDLKDLFSSPLLDTFNVPVKVETGSCLLAKKDFDRLHIGDFLVLDTCSYDPHVRKGTLNLTFGKTPLFKVKIKKDGLKILDYLTYYGDTNTMDEEIDPILPDEESSSELDVPEETAPLPEEMLSSSLDIPFPIVVEIDRMLMPLKKILSLEPGNILEIPTHPEQGVYLTVHGKKIAKGELIKLGDAIGVKIVSLGESSPL